MPTNEISSQKSYDYVMASRIFDWLKSHGVYIGLPTCIELFDELAADFMENKSDRNKIIDLTGNEISKIEDKTKRVSLKMGF